MTDFAVGDTVRIKDPDGYLKWFGDKVRDRDAQVLEVISVDGWREVLLRVRFLKRNGRGKEFEERLRARAFTKVEPPAKD